VAAPAQAVLTPPATIDGPSSSILEFGGVAMAPDGTGGVVYLKQVEGVPHVFAARYVAGRWSSPIRVDLELPYAASEPRIAAGSGGELMVVWVIGDATVAGKIQHGLYSARLGSGATGFGSALLIDPKLGEGVGVAPSVAGTLPGQAIVAYRVVTHTFNPLEKATRAVQLRSGDVMADIRVARFGGERWSRLGAINRNSEASMRPPSPYNGPQVGIGAEGNAVVAWQEPDQTGVARIWARRIFGSSVGPPLEASPATWAGSPVTADADAFSLSVTTYVQARIAIRIADTPGSALAGRLLLNTLPPSYATEASKLTGPVLADGGASPGSAGSPSVAAAQAGSTKEGAMRLGFVVGSEFRQIGVESSGVLGNVNSIPGPPAAVGATPVVAVDPAGGGLAAYPATGPEGDPELAVLQEDPSGGAQSALISGAGGGPISELGIGRPGTGDGLIGFRQGEPGDYSIVAERGSAPPASFPVTSPKGWVSPAKAKLTWRAAPSAVGGVSYSVLIEGRIVSDGLTTQMFHPPPAAVGNGVRFASVMATDALGGQVLSRSVKLKVDVEAPTVKVSTHRLKARVRLRDTESGLKTSADVVNFGDGTREHGLATFHHTYDQPGRYTITVRSRDRVGNHTHRSFEVVVK
jgi:hypothetical protein